MARGKYIVLKHAKTLPRLPRDEKGDGSALRTTLEKNKQADKKFVAAMKEALAKKD